MPMLAMQKQLWEQMTTDASPNSLFKWITKMTGKTEPDDDDDHFTQIFFKTYFFLHFTSAVLLEYKRLPMSFDFIAC